MTKTFKIGEYAVGGTIRVSIPKTLTTIKIEVIDSNFKTNKLLNQYIYYSFDRIRMERDLFEYIWKAKKEKEAYCILG